MGLLLILGIKVPMLFSIVYIVLVLWCDIIYEVRKLITEGSVAKTMLQ